MQKNTKTTPLTPTPTPQDEWLSMAHLLYSHLSTTTVPMAQTITAARFTKVQSYEYPPLLPRKSFKYQAYQLLLAGTSEAGNGFFSVNKVESIHTQLDIPFQGSVQDERLKC